LGSKHNQKKIKMLETKEKVMDWVGNQGSDRVRSVWEEYGHGLWRNLEESGYVGI
jgi:hypothetical protein